MLVKTIIIFAVGGITLFLLFITIFIFWWNSSSSSESETEPANSKPIKIIRVTTNRTNSLNRGSGGIQPPTNIENNDENFTSPNDGNTNIEENQIPYKQTPFGGQRTDFSKNKKEISGSKKWNHNHHIHLNGHNTNNSGQ